VPVGVEPSPSRLCADSPPRPSRASHGPATRRQHDPLRIHNDSDPLVACAGATTVTSCVELWGAAKQATLIAAMVPYTATVERVTAHELRDSWHAGCPVAPSQLRRIRLRYVGFDGRSHVGQLVVNGQVVPQVIEIFRRLYAARFPSRRMQPVDVYHGSDDRAAAADDTSAFNCRRAVAPGATSWSMHAYGEAIDVNDVENPYLEGTRVIPPAGKAFTDRAHVRPGMAVEAGPLVRAFDAAGWGWGGRWSGSPDYQHFSVNGR
jgi:hypothetical protein